MYPIMDNNGITPWMFKYSFRLEWCWWWVSAASTVMQWISTIASTVIQWNSPTTSTVIQYHSTTAFTVFQCHSTTASTVIWWNSTTASTIIQWNFTIVSMEFQRVHRVNGHSTASMKPKWSRSPCWQMHALPRVNVWWSFSDLFCDFDIVVIIQPGGWWRAGLYSSGLVHERS